MKKILAFTLLALLCVAPMLADDNDYSEITFDTKSHNFGTIKEKDGPVTYEFRFTNTGNKPLLIIDAVASCGCTRPEFPTKPIKPGKSGKIKVTYNPAGRPGAFRKSVKIKTNAINYTSTLSIEGTVIPK